MATQQSIVRRTAVVLASVLCASLSAEHAPSPITLIAKIPLLGVHGRIGHLAADYYQGRLFVAAAGNDTVEVIDVRNNALLASIREVSEPHSVAYVKSSNRLFVTNSGDGSLRQFDGTTLKLMSNVRLGQEAGIIRVDSMHDRVYVGYGDGAIAVLDLTGKRLAEITLKSHPESFQLAEKEPRLFVNLPGSHAVAVVDTNSGKVMAEWPLQDGLENFALAIDEDKRRVFVALRRPSRLLVLDMDSGAVIARLPAAGDADDLFFDAIHGRIYVTGGRGQVGVYAEHGANEYAQTDSVATVAGSRTGLFVAEWNRLFVAVRDFAGHAAEIRIYQPR